MTRAGRNSKAAAAALAALLGTLLGAAAASAAAPVVMTGAAKEIARTSMTLCGTVNPEGEATTFDFVYEYYEAGWHTATTAPESAGEGETAVEECTNVTGLQAGQRYAYKIAAKNASGEQTGYNKYVETVTAVEELKTEPASNLKRLGTTSEVTLNGSLAPNGYDTHYYFEYKKGSNLYAVGSLENEVTPALPGADAGEASKLEHVSVTITIPTNVEYAYRLVGVNEFGATGGSIEKVIVPAVEGVETLAPTEVTASSAMLHGTFEPNGYDTHWQFACYIFNFGAGANPTFMVPDTAVDAGSANGPVAVEATLARLSNGDPLEGNTPMSCRLVASDSLGSDQGAQVQLTTLNAAPAFAGGAEPTVTSASAGVHANLLTQNERTTYWVEYVDAAGYEPSAANPYESGGVAAASEVQATPYVVANVTRGLTGLAPATTYHYRFVAENATGTAYGPDGTFTTAPLTPPVAVTGAASGVSGTRATITGTVDPEGLKTSYEFQIGETASYGGAEIFGDAGEGGGEEAVSTTLGYLVPGTTYHYRLLATNVDGTTYGPDETFTTPGIASPVSQPAAMPLLNVTLGTEFPVEKVVTVSTRHKHHQKRHKRKHHRHGGRHQHKHKQRKHKKK